MAERVLLSPNTFTVDSCESRCAVGLFPSNGSSHMSVKHVSKLKKPDHPPPGVTAHGLRVNGLFVSFHRKEVGPQRWLPDPKPTALLLPSSLPPSFLPPSIPDPPPSQASAPKERRKERKLNHTSVMTPCEPSTPGFSALPCG